MLNWFSAYKVAFWFAERSLWWIRWPTKFFPSIICTIWVICLLLNLFFVYTLKICSNSCYFSFKLRLNWKYYTIIIPQIVIASKLSFSVLKSYFYIFMTEFCTHLIINSISYLNVLKLENIGVKKCYLSFFTIVDNCNSFVKNKYAQCTVSSLLIS